MDFGKRQSVKPKLEALNQKLATPVPMGFRVFGFGVLGFGVWVLEFWGLGALAFGFREHR